MKGKNDIKIKRKIGAVVVLGVFMSIMLVSVAVCADDDWFEIGNDVPPSDIQDEIWTLGKVAIGIEGLEIGSLKNTLEVNGNVSIGEGYANVYWAPKNGMIIEGKVGIGVTDPAEKLEIDGNILFNTGADRSIYVEKPSTTHTGYSLTVEAGDAYHPGVGGSAGGHLYLGGGDGDGTYNANGGDVYIYGGARDGDSSDGDVILAHTGTDGRGKVGILTANPLEALHVEGNIRVDNKVRGDDSDGLRLADGNGITRIRIENDGDVLIGSEVLGGHVGIGTNNPTSYARLHIRENTGDSAIAFSLNSDSPQFVFGVDATDSKFKIHSGTSLADTSDFTITSDGNVGIGTANPSASLHVDQSSITGTKPVLTVDQADVSEEFIKFIGTSANGVLTQSIVDINDVTTPTLEGYLKIYVQDDGNQLTDQPYFIPIYTLI